MGPMLASFGLPRNIATLRYRSAYTTVSSFTHVDDTRPLPAALGYAVPWTKAVPPAYFFVASFLTNVLCTSELLRRRHRTALLMRLHSIHNEPRHLLQSHKEGGLAAAKGDRGHHPIRCRVLRRIRGTGNHRLRKPTRRIRCLPERVPRAHCTDP